ncbi:retrovirus-related pol polyprotein from transposon TNT 1-94 [Tanacetum coccineum]
MEYAPIAYQQQQPEFSQPDSSLVVLVFQKGDDPIDAINHMMSFLTAVGRQTTYAVGTTRKYTPGASGSNTGKQRTVICYKLAKDNDVSEQSNDVSQSETEITSDSNIIPYSQYLSEAQQETVQNSNSSAQQDVMILSMFEQLTTQKARESKPKLYDGNTILKMDTIVIPDSDETLMLCEESRSKLILKEQDQMVVTHEKNTATAITEDNSGGELRAQSQAKDTVIVKLKEQIKSLNGNVDDSTVKMDMDEIETLNIELEHRVYQSHPGFAIQHISRSCPSINNFGPQLVEVTPRKKDKKVRSKTFYQIVQRVTAVRQYKNEGFRTHRTQKPIVLDSESPKPVVKLVYSRKPRKNKNTESVSKTKVDKSSSVKFGNDQVAKIMGYGDYQIGNVTISRVYYVEGLGHNLFSVGQFCDSNLEVAFRQHTCFIRNLEGVDLLTGSRGDNLYTLSLGNMMASSPICLLSKASKTKSWLWHRRLSHLNFGAINHLARHGLVRGLPKLKFEKDHLCSACALGKSSKKPHKPKSEDTNQEKLYLLHMDLCGPMCVASVNGKKYILVIVDDYSRFTWVKCLRSKDEAPAFIINFLKMIQVRLKETVRRIRTDNGTEFVNQTLREYYEKVGISHETSVAHSPQQNGVVERLNHTLIATACYTQNRSMIRRCHGKTPYELLHDKPPDLSYLHVRTRRIIETIHVDFDELTAMASEHSSSGPALHDMTPVIGKKRVYRFQESFAPVARIKSYTNFFSRAAPHEHGPSNKWDGRHYCVTDVDYSHGGEVQTDKDREGKAVDSITLRAAIPKAADNVQTFRFKSYRPSVSHHKEHVENGKVEATLKSAWTEKDQIDNLLIERRSSPWISEGNLKLVGETFASSDTTQSLSRSVEVLKLKEISRKMHTIKLFKNDVQNHNVKYKFKEQAQSKKSNRITTKHIHKKSQEDDQRLRKKHSKARLLVFYNDYPSRGYHAISCVDLHSAFTFCAIYPNKVVSEPGYDKQWQKMEYSFKEPLAKGPNLQLERFKLRSGKVHLAYDKTLDIAGVGDVVLKTSFGTSWTLKDVRYIPGLKRRRLISAGQLEEEGYHVGFRDQQWKVLKICFGVQAHGNQLEAYIWLRYTPMGIAQLLMRLRIPRRNDEGRILLVHLKLLGYEESPGYPNQDITLRLNLMEPEINLDPGGSSDTSEGSENSGSFKDSGRSDEEYSEDGASSKEGGFETPQVRRSTRESRAPVRYSPSANYLLLTENGEPESYSEALSSKESVQWKKAIIEEMVSLEKNQTWSLVRISAGKKASQRLWMFRVKEEQDGSKRYKARLVVKGFQQKRRVDYNEILSLVVKMTTIKLVLSIVAAGAFLVGALN